MFFCIALHSLHPQTQYCLCNLKSPGICQGFIHSAILTIPAEVIGGFIDVGELGIVQAGVEAVLS